MAAPAGEIFEFGDFTLDPTDRLLLLRGQPLRLTPKTFDTFWSRWSVIAVA